MLYPPEERSDLPSEVHLAELIREQVLSRTWDEVPHAVEVVVERGRRAARTAWSRWRRSSGSRPSRRRASWSERAGEGARDRAPAARRELERELGARVFLDLRVKVREHWRRDDCLLDRIGIE